MMKLKIKLLKIEPTEKPFNTSKSITTLKPIPEHWKQIIKNKNFIDKSSKSLTFATQRNSKEIKTIKFTNQIEILKVEPPNYSLKFVILKPTKTPLN